MVNPFAQETRVLHSSLDPESCRARLAAETGSLWNPFSGWSHPVRGRVTEKGFWIVRSIHYRNSFQTVARGRWSAEDRGTRIDLTLGASTGIRVFFVAWLALIVAVALIWWLSGGAATTVPPDAKWFSGVLPFLFVIFAALLIKFGRWLSRHDAVFLTEFLTRTLECSPDATPIT